MPGADRPLVALRADGAPSAGFGHVRRCLALADALAPWAERRMLLDADGAAMALVRSRGLPCEKVGDDLGALLAAVEGLRADALVVDSYALPLSALRPLRDPLRLLVAIDDAAEYPLPAHLVVNAAPGVRPGNGGGENYLLGTSFALLNPEFADVPARDWVRAPARVFVTLGATAPPGLMGTLVTATRQALPRAAIDVVIGPAADQFLVNRALQPIRDVTVHAAPSDIRALMLAADLAVTAGGGTVFELAATGMPMVGVALAANQRPNLIGLSEAQALIFAGAAEDIGLAATVEDALQTLALDANRRRALGARARRLVDGRGAARVAEAMRARLAGTPWPARAAT